MHYKIGEVSRLLDNTSQSLRFYEQAGVLTPHKSENGTRYYDEAQVNLLLSFKKYRAMGFSIQEIVEHFRAGSLEELEPALEQKAVALREQAAAALRLADAIETHRDSMNRALWPEPPVRQTRPAVYALKGTIEKLPSAKEPAFANTKSWISAMPATRLSIFAQTGAQREPAFGLSVEPELWHSWGLDRTQCDDFLPEREDCAYLTLSHDVTTPYRDMLDRAAQRVADSGMTPETGALLWGRQLASQTRGKQVELFFELWVPILPEKREAKDG